jgi:hypothetical protein
MNDNDDIGLDEEPCCSHQHLDGTPAWILIGTAYGGDDPRWLGEGRVYCEVCGAEGGT